MDDFQKINIKARLYFFALLVAENTLLAAAWLTTQRYVPYKWQLIALLGAEVLLVALSWLVATITVRWLLSPLKLLWQTILFLSPTTTGAAPNTDNQKFGHELVANLSNQIYQLAAASSASASKPSAERLDFICNNLPLPLLVIDEKDNLKFANAAASTYLKEKPVDLIGKNIYGLLDMSFSSEDTFDNWLKQARKDKATGQKTWNRVKLARGEEPPQQFDLAAYYNRGNSQHYETILTFFDKTTQYGSDDDQASFVALAVHELRNPLTMLRGYIEVLEEEVDDKTNLELTTDLQKMRSSAQLLSDYTNNILNVSRVDSDQLSLRLKSEAWPGLINGVVESMRLRARVHGLTIELKVADGLPPVGVDHVSISEVLTNLIDNAIKYSQGSKPIQINSRLNQNGEVETTIKNYGVVIGADVMGHLFQRFYRNHRSRAEVGGTGLGLFLSKAFVEAHGGNIWVMSNEKDGTTFGFTVLAYDKVADKSAEDNEIIRVPHGWIKNHSLYRR